MSHEVFLSYAAVDKTAALAVLAGLEEQGIPCWIAPRDIPAGSEYGEQIIEAVKACRIVVVIFSAGANASPHVRREVERAVSTEKTIVPFRIENVTPTGAMEYALGNTHWLDALSRPLAPHVATLVATLRRLLGTGATAAGAPGVSAGTARPSIVVLPFNNMSGDPEQEYFSDGITEDIITDLSKVSGLFVIARNSAFTYKGKTVKVQEVSRDLGVSYVLEGSVRKAAARVRVTAQLINGADAGHVWADRYDRDLTDIFSIQDEITHAIVEQLKVKLLPQEKKSIAQAPTDNVEAYTYYLRGRQFLHRHSKSYYQLARRMFVKAVELDPTYARAYAGIADCDSFLFVHYRADVSIDAILAASARALELDAGLAEAHASRALALSLVQRNEEAMAEFERAIRLDPNSFEAHYFYARARFVQNELALHPDNPRPAYMGANDLIALGELDRGREWLSRALAIDPDDVLTQYNVACAYSKLGDSDAAFDLLEKLLSHASAWVKTWIRVDSDFERLRSLPRYRKIQELIE